MIIPGVVASAVGGSSPYTAQAVHFDGTVGLIRFGNLSGVADSPFGLLSYWAQVTGPVGYQPLFNSETTVQVFETPSGNTLPFFFADSSFTNRSNVNINFPDDPFDGDWYNFLMAWNTNFTAGSRIYQFYFNDAPIPIDASGDTGGPYSIDYSNAGGDLQFPTWRSQNGSIGNFADAVIYLGATLDLSVTANRRKFIGADGKPVSPTNFPASPTILWSGDKDTFSTNQGSAGAFEILEGTLGSDTIVAHGPTSISLPGAVAGKSVALVRKDSDGSDITSQFEATISVNDHIQQTGSTDLTGENAGVSCFGSLTNAPTSPST